VALANGKDAGQLLKDTVTRMLEITAASSQDCSEASSKPTVASLLSTRTWFTVSTGCFHRDAHRWTTEAADELEPTVIHIQQDNPAAGPECRAGGYRPH
jgi:hypothetical protein